jgi:hypothetical protein
MLRCENLQKFFRLLISVFLAGSAAFGSTPLRVDINADGRADMRTLGWDNWRPSVDRMRQSFGDITVTLSPSSDQGTISLKANKAMIVHGVTLGADAAVATGGPHAAMNVQIEGLTAGPHSFVGYHYSLSGESAGTYTVSTGDRKVEGIQLPNKPRHNDEVGTSYIEFEAREGQPVVIRIAAEDSGTPTATLVE